MLEPVVRPLERAERIPAEALRWSTVARPALAEVQLRVGHSALAEVQLRVGHPALAKVH